MAGWLRREDKYYSSNSYESVLAMTAQALFDTSVLTAGGISQTWTDKTGGNSLLNEQAWTIQVELTWFFVAAICREVFNMEQGGEKARDTIQDDLISAVINHMLDRMFDWSQESSDKRSEQANRLLEWHNEAEVDYGDTTQITPSKNHIALEDNLVGKWAIRVAKATGNQQNIGLMIYLSMVAMRAYIAVNLPKCTVDLVHAHAASSR